jgi:ssDNA-binding Zn-finger/Zn-ribbon topoisomerase 1
MPSTEEREAQPVLEDPCPRCGSPVVLRYWQGRFFTKCQNSGCAFGFDADNRGNPAARCGVCGTGRMRTQDRARVCADCGAEAGAPKPAASPQPEPASASGLGACPKCGKGQLAVHTGAYGTFVSCSERCGLSYTSDAEGVPAGGTCKACRGPVKKTQNGSRVCAVCGTWQDEKKPAVATKPGTAEAVGARPPKPKPAQCPRCSRPLKEVFTRRQKWAYRCDACDSWFDA